MDAKNRSRVFWKRGAAYLVDLFFLYTSTVLTMTFLLFTYAILRGEDSKSLIALAESDATKHTTRILQGLYYVSYFTISHWYFGRTIGKYFWGLSVKSKDGKDLSFLHSLGRTFAYVLSGYPTLGLGYFLALWRQDARSLHDLIAQTKVEEKTEQAISQDEKIAA